MEAKSASWKIVEEIFDVTTVHHWRFDTPAGILQIDILETYLLHDTSCLFIATLAKQTLDGRSPFSRKWSGYPMRRSSHSRHPLARKFGWPSWQWRLELAAQLQGLSCQNVEVEEQRNSNGSDETELKEDNVIWWYLMNGTDQGRAVLWGGPALMYSKT